MAPRNAVPVRAAEGQVGPTARTSVTGGSSAPLTLPGTPAEGRTYAIKIQAQSPTSIAQGYLKMGTGGPTAAPTDSYPIGEGEIFIWHMISGWDEAAYIQRDSAVDTYVFITELNPDAA